MWDTFFSFIDESSRPLPFPLSLSLDVPRVHEAFFTDKDNRVNHAITVSFLPLSRLTLPNRCLVSIECISRRAKQRRIHSLMRFSFDKNNNKEKEKRHHLCSSSDMSTKFTRLKEKRSALDCHWAIEECLKKKRNRRDSMRLNNPCVLICSARNYLDQYDLS